jgi:5'-deoxynucleotidase
MAMVPDALQADYRPLLFPVESDTPLWHLVKAADKVCAYVKCLEEVAAGNNEFAKAEKALRAAVDALDLPEVRYFMETFAPSFRLTLDELG